MKLDQGGNLMDTNLEKLKAEGDLSISPRRKEWRESLPREIKELLEEDAKYFIHQSLSTPCLNVLRNVSGSYIEDITGKKYLDFHGNSVHDIGFSHPKDIEAVKNQLDKLSICPRRYTNVVATQLAKRLVELAPGALKNNSRVLFSPGGAEAMEMAYKLAIRATKKLKTVSWWDAFHGATVAAISIGGEAIFRSGLPLLAGTEHVAPPSCYRCPYGHKGPDKCDFACAEMVKYVIEKNAGDVAAVIAEPIRGAHVNIPPKEYWKIVKDACEEEGALLIFDEILSGLGRTGKMFACEHFGVTPDIVLIGKSLGGGVVPIAGMIASEEIADKVSDRSIDHFTHEKSPVGAAASLTVLNVIEEEGVVERAKEMGNYTLKRLEDMKNQHEIIGDVRGVGLFLAIELVKDRKKKTKASEETEEVMYRCLKRGLSFKTTGGNIISLMPALTITKKEMDTALDILEESISEVERK